MLDNFQVDLGIKIKQLRLHQKTLPNEVKTEILTVQPSYQNDTTQNNTVVLIGCSVKCVLQRNNVAQYWI